MGAARQCAHALLGSEVWRGGCDEDHRGEGASDQERARGGRQLRLAARKGDPAGKAFERRNLMVGLLQNVSI